MDTDDVLVGRLLSRREVLGLMGAAGLALVVGCGSDDDTPTATATRASGPTPTAGLTSEDTSPATAGSTAVPSCVVRPELTEGPYFVDEMLERSDIRSDPTDGSVREGAELRLIVNVSSVGDGTCEPLEGAMVDVWHCDAAGVYSDVTDPSFDTSGQKWLRGFQRTDANGQVQFTTIYPGWYKGRAVHIHFKIRTDPAAARGYDFTSQLYFDDALTDRVLAQAPYAARGQRRQRNDDDGIYRNGGRQLMLPLARDGAGYAGTFEIGLSV